MCSACGCGLSYDPAGAQWQFVEAAQIFGPIGWKLGIDGISLMLIMLSVFLMPICIGASWHAIDKRVGEYMAAFLLMETLMIGVFSAQDLLLFYIFFEAGLIPMYLIIGIWGGAERIYASYKFFLYTLLGSVVMLIAMLWMIQFAGTADIPTLLNTDFPVEAQKWLWLAFFASFAVKMPMWPVHTWLPDAHVQAPTAGSVILAGVLLKMGGYGFLRFSIPMFPEASADFIPLVFGLSMVAVVYTSLVALVQNDMKKLIAYSSVAHMAIVTVGLFTFNQQGIEGAIIVMLSHGLVSGALFLCVGVIYDRLHTREISRYGGLSINMPKYALLFMLFTMASVGLPGTSGFVGEFLALAGAYKVSTWATLIATTGIILRRGRGGGGPGRPPEGPLSGPHHPGAFPQPEKGPGGHRRASRTLWGPGYIEEQLGRSALADLAPTLFCKPIPPPPKAYINAISRLGEFTGQETVWDLYCGAGSIALHLASQVRRVVGFELVPAAVNDAYINSRLNGLDNCQFLAGDLKERIREAMRASRHHPRPDVVDHRPAPGRHAPPGGASHQGAVPPGASSMFRATPPPWPGTWPSSRISTTS